MHRFRHSLVFYGPGCVCSDRVNIREDDVRTSCILLEIVVFAIEAE